MRLSTEQRAAIKRIAHDLAGPAARVRLFGSRVREDLRGGDIDLLVDLPSAPADAFALGLRLGARLERELGGRKVDVIIAAPDTPVHPVLAAARREGVDL